MFQVSGLQVGAPKFQSSFSLALRAFSRSFDSQLVVHLVTQRDSTSILVLEFDAHTFKGSLKLRRETIDELVKGHS